MDNFIGRLFINGKIKVLSGIHIGTGIAGGIGLIDNPVIRDPISKRPYIPGSSLKGRLRHALWDLTPDAVPDEVPEEVARLFGTAPKNENSRNDNASNNGSGGSRLLVRDSLLTTDSISKLEQMDTTSLFVEVKTENCIDRATGTAKDPRQMERLPAGTDLEFEFVYNCDNLEHFEEDLRNLQAAMKFVEDEYLGGSGSRGYGKINFEIDGLSWKDVDTYLDHREAKTIKPGNNWVADAVNLCDLKVAVRN